MTDEELDAIKERAEKSMVAVPAAVYFSGSGDYEQWGPDEGFARFDDAQRYVEAHPESDGPHILRVWGPGVSVVPDAWRNSDFDGAVPDSIAGADFVAHAREDVLALVAEVERLRVFARGNQPIEDDDDDDEISDDDLGNYLFFNDLNPQL